MARREVLLIATLVACADASAHGGGLDAYGCHNDRRSGGYHCHRAPAVPPPPARSYAPPPPAAPLPAQPATTPAFAPVQPLAGSVGSGVSSPSLVSPHQTSGTFRRGAVWKYSVDGSVSYATSQPADPSAEVLFEFVESSGQMWMIVFKASGGVEVAIHRASIVPVGDSRMVWVLLDFQSAVQERGKRLGSKVERWTVNCSGMSVLVSDVVAYGGRYGSGEVVDTWRGDRVSRGAVPGSAGEAVAQQVCFSSDAGDGRERED